MSKDNEVNTSHESMKNSDGIVDVDTLKQFIIPKKRKTKRGLLEPLLIKSEEFRQDVLPTILSSYKDREAKKLFRYTQAWLVHNEELSKTYADKRKEMRQNGYTEKEVQDSFAFVCVDNFTEAKTICRDGVYVQNSNLTCFGNPYMGVYLCRHADIIRRDLPTAWDLGGKLIIFKVIKGKVKLMVENRNNVPLDPTPNYDCHMSKIGNFDMSATSLQYAYESSQIYIYEYGEDGVESRPRQILPYAVFEFEFLTQNGPDKPPVLKQSMKPTLSRSYPTSMPPLLMPQLSYSDSDGPPSALSAETRPLIGRNSSSSGSPGRPPVLDESVNNRRLSAYVGTVTEDEGVVLWAGKLLCFDLPVEPCEVKVISHGAHFLPIVGIDLQLNELKSGTVESLRGRFFDFPAHKQLQKNSEVKIRSSFGNANYCYSYCQLRPVKTSQGEFNQLMTLLARKELGLYSHLSDDSSIVILSNCQLTQSLGLNEAHHRLLTLHCIFIVSENFSANNIMSGVRKRHMEPVTSSHENSCQVTFGSFDNRIKFSDQGTTLPARRPPLLSTPIAASLRPSSTLLNRAVANSLLTPANGPTFSSRNDSYAIHTKDSQESSQSFQLLIAEDNFSFAPEDKLLMGEALELAFDESSVVQDKRNIELARKMAATGTGAKAPVTSSVQHRDPRIRISGMGPQSALANIIDESELCLYPFSSVKTTPTTMTTTLSTTPMSTSNSNSLRAKESNKSNVLLSLNKAKTLLSSPETLTRRRQLDGEEMKKVGDGVVTENNTCIPAKTSANNVTVLSTGNTSVVTTTVTNPRSFGDPRHRTAIPDPRLQRRSLDDSQRNLQESGTTVMSVSEKTDSTLLKNSPDSQPSATSGSAEKTVRTTALSSFSLLDLPFPSTGWSSGTIRFGDLSSMPTTKGGSPAKTVEREALIEDKKKVFGRTASSETAADSSSTKKQKLTLNQYKKITAASCSTKVTASTETVAKNKTEATINSKPVTLSAVTRDVEKNIENENKKKRRKIVYSPTDSLCSSNSSEEEEEDEVESEASCYSPGREYERLQSKVGEREEDDCAMPDYLVDEIVKRPALLSSSVVVKPLKSSVESAGQAVKGEGTGAGGSVVKPREDKGPHTPSTPVSGPRSQSEYVLSPVGSEASQSAPSSLLEQSLTSLPQTLSPKEVKADRSAIDMLEINGGIVGKERSDEAMPSRGETEGGGTNDMDTGHRRNNAEDLLDANKLKLLLNELPKLLESYDLAKRIKELPIDFLSLPQAKDGSSKPGDITINTLASETNEQNDASSSFLATNEPNNSQFESAAGKNSNSPESSNVLSINDQTVPSLISGEGNHCTDILLAANAELVNAKHDSANESFESSGSLLSASPPASPARDELTADHCRFLSPIQSPDRDDNALHTIPFRMLYDDDVKKDFTTPALEIDGTQAYSFLAQSARKSIPFLETVMVDDEVPSKSPTLTRGALRGENVLTEKCSARKLPDDLLLPKAEETKLSDNVMTSPLEFNNMKSVEDVSLLYDKNASDKLIDGSCLNAGIEPVISNEINEELVSPDESRNCVKLVPNSCSKASPSGGILYMSKDTDVSKDLRTPVSLSKLSRVKAVDKNIKDSSKRKSEALSTSRKSKQGNRRRNNSSSTSSSSSSSSSSKSSSSSSRSSSTHSSSSSSSSSSKSSTRSESTSPVKKGKKKKVPTATLR